MSRKLIIPVICAAVICVAGVGIALLATAGSADSGRGVCLKHPLRAMVAHGKSPSGHVWNVAGHLRNDAKCHTRMLELSFRPFGHSGAVWGAGYGVPIGGSLSSTFVIASRQLKKFGEIAYGGVTSRKVALVEASTRNGGWVKIETEPPQAPSVPRWLRNVRYFMEFLPANGKVERIRVRDRAGRVLYQGGESILGEFDDVGVL